MAVVSDAAQWTPNPKFFIALESGSPKDASFPYTPLNPATGGVGLAARLSLRLVERLHLGCSPVY